MTSFDLVESFANCFHVSTYINSLSLHNYTLLIPYSIKLNPETSMEEAPFKLEGPKLPDIKQMDSPQHQLLSKQKQILSKLIFPPHIPGECHPKVAQMASIIKELDSKEENLDDNSVSSSSPLLSEIDLPKIDRSLAKDLRELRSKCIVYAQRSQQYQKELLKLKKDDASKKEIMETASYAKLYELNFNYCIASVTSPRRMNALNRCFSSLDPNLVRALAQAGQFDFICPQERKAVERAVGQKVQSAVRASQQL